jgi:hypothetical protein
MFMQDATRLVPHPIDAQADPGLAATQAGLAADTWVETEAGWRQAGLLRRGDRIYTFDGGLRAIVALDRPWILPGPQGQALHLPGGTLGSTTDLTLMPDQHLLIDTWDEAGLDGAVAALIRASALGGLAGIGWRPVPAPRDVVTPVFSEDEVIYASGGVLPHCPGANRRTQGDAFLGLPPNRDRPSCGRVWRPDGTSSHRLSPCRAGAVRID